MSAPQSVIHICSGVRLNSGYAHTAYFGSISEQENYFAGKVVKTFSAYSFIRPEWDLQVVATLEEARTWNYLFFRNTPTGKTYYYFVEKIEYVNDSSVRLKLRMDVMQTYIRDFKLTPCFVERNHAITDPAFSRENLLEEDLEIGEYIRSTWVDTLMTNFTTNMCILVLSTFNPNYANTGTPVPALSGLYNNTFSGLKVWAVRKNDWARWGSQLDLLAEAGFLDGIIAMWMYPMALIELGGENTWSDGVLCKVVAGATSVQHDLNITAGSQNGDMFAPLNKKAVGYPYNFLSVTNHLGERSILKLEHFKDPVTPKFKFYGAISPESGVVCVPLDYRGFSESWDDAITLPPYPSCAWDSDIYKMWLAQNQAQHAVAMVDGGVKVGAGAVAAVAGLATGGLGAAIGGAGLAYNGASQIANLLAQKKDMSVIAPSARGTFSASIPMAAGKGTFMIERLCIPKERMKIIDDYFTMYGYKVNRVREPYLVARKKFTYVKTIGSNVYGEICDEDRRMINAIFDNGITFWTDPDNIGEYELLASENKPLM